MCRALISAAQIAPKIGLTVSSIVKVLNRVRVKMHSQVANGQDAVETPG